MRPRWKLLGLGLVAIALAGCATFQRPTQSDPQNGAIFGYFALPESYGYLQYMSIMGDYHGIRPYLGIPNDVQYIIRDGAFFAYDARPAKYLIESIYTNGAGLFGSEQDQLTLVQGKLGDKAYNEKVMKENQFTVKPHELVYWGAAQIYVGRHEGLFTNGTFSVGPDRNISEKQVLEKLMPALKGTPYEQQAQTLLASLK